MSSSSPLLMLLQISMTMVFLIMAVSAGNFYKDVDITWGDGRAKILNGGKVLTLSLDKFSGSGFQSKNEFLFGRFDLQLKLVPANSAGTVTTFFLTSHGSAHDEIDFEFLGNVSGQPYTVHTNIYAQGKGNREQQFRLWFDPTAAFHTYSIIWNPQHIIFLVDNSPIRIFNNNERIGVSFPRKQPMRLHCSLWNADDWATQGGRIKTDWEKSPFVASYRNINLNGNIACSSPSSSCSSRSSKGGRDSFKSGAWKNQGLDDKERNRLRWIQSKLMIYDYCQDISRFPMGVPAECRPMLIRIVFLMACLMAATAGNFNTDTTITWGDGRGKILNGGQLLTLSLDNYSGSGFESKNQYLYGRFDVQIKLVPGNSAGTVTTFFLSSQGTAHDEIDFEFLGNVSGQPYTVHTNIYAQGKGNKEQQFRLWFDPTAAFHTYSIVWNPQRIIFLVDNSPIRVFNNYAAFGIPFPTSLPMKMYSSLWNADDWATQGGRVKTDWTKAPFVASYRNLNINANSCNATTLCSPNSLDAFRTAAWLNQGLDSKGRNRLRWVQSKFMIYDYCKDFARFPQGVSAECKLSRF
ncbi:hypothetical protein M9H77_21361 [Catharanthus roseus]|uniref:Uncharacterized protein n=1 Tax=Catharanthus roseus TaxID=4058 RepID=A0ACC0AM63_CATRO|nr:hypothetical protein M9H77_21361 [Catharanthus roseus]